MSRWNEKTENDKRHDRQNNLNELTKNISKRRLEKSWKKNRQYHQNRTMQNNEENLYNLVGREA